MPEVLVGLLQQFWPYIAGLTTFGMAGSYSVWGGTQSSNGTPGGMLDTILHSIITAPAKVLGSFVGGISGAHKATRSAVSHWAVAQEKTMAAWFTHLNVLTRAVFESNLATAKGAAAAVGTLAARQAADRQYKDGTLVKTRATTALNTATTALARTHSLSTTLTREHAAQVKLNVHYTHAIDVTLPQKIGHIGAREEKLSRDQAKLRDRTTSLENGALKAFRWLRTHPEAAVTGVFAGAVAIALDRIGLGALRCRNFTNLLKRYGCGLGTLLEGLLGLAVSALALENVCALLPVLETAFGDVVGPVTHLLTEVPLGGCERPPKSWAALNVAAGPLPPQQTLGSLPV